MTNKRRAKVRPSRSSPERSRTRGVRRSQLSFKADEDLKSYVETEAKQRGWSITTVLNDMLTTQMALEKSLGEAWWDIESESVRLRVPKGKLLADLVAAALKKR